MPRATLVLRNFFGGLADDPSPRDLREDELAEIKGFHVNTEGQLTPFGSLAPDTAVGTSGNFTTVISNWGGISIDTSLAGLDGGGIYPLRGLYTFSADRTPSGGLGKVNYVAFAGVTSSAYPSDHIWAICQSDGTPLKDVGSTATNNFHMTTMAAGVSQVFMPVAYKVAEGVRFVPGNTTTVPIGSSLSTGTFDYPIVKAQSLFYADRKHFIVDGATTQIYDGWYWRPNTLESPDLGFAIYLDQPYLKEDGTGSATVFNATDADAFGSVTGNRFTASFAASQHYLFALNETTNLAALVQARNSSKSLQTGTISTNSWAAGTRDDNIAYLAPPAGRGFNVHCNFFGSAGEWEAGSWEFYSTFKYDDSEQESLPFPMANWPNPVDIFSNRPSGIASVAGQSLRFSLATKAPFNPRITGGRLYAINAAQPEDGLLLIADISLEQGVRASLNDDYEPWQGWYPYYVSTLDRVDSPSGDTYESINGFDPFDINHYRRDAAVLGATTGTSTIAMQINYAARDVATYRNVVYLGNVIYWDRRYPDSVFKSFPGRPDVFVPEQRFDLNTEDGDEVVALHAYGDRLLVFKTKTLYIINIASEDEFFEFERPGLGISNRHQVVSMENGVAWFNSDGSWFFDGESIVETFYDLREPGRRKINIANWQSFLGVNPFIGYIKDQKSVLIVNEAFDSAPPDARMMSIKTAAWSEKPSVYRTTRQISPTFRLLSNPVLAWDNDMRVLDLNTQDLLKYSTRLTTQSGSQASIKFPSLDMGEPGLQKNLHKIRITYKSGEDANAKYLINGTTTVHSFNETTPLVVNSSWVSRTLTPASTPGSRNWYSLQLKISPFGGTFSGDVTIDDVTIIYRLKRPR